MFEKWVWIVSPAASGIALCIWGNSAFAAMGIILGLAAFGLGLYFFFMFMSCRERLGLALGLMAGGIALVVLCAVFEGVSFFLGGLLFAAAGVFVIIIRLSPKINYIRNPVFYIAFAAFCILIGLVMLFVPSFLGWMSIFAGVGLLVFSGIMLISAY